VVFRHECGHDVEVDLLRRHCGAAVTREALTPPRPHEESGVPVLLTRYTRHV
jgi:hypothetical protein